MNITEMMVESWPDPTQEMLNDPRFEAIWQRIKSWDINVPGIYSGYCGANGNHVRAILDAVVPPAPSPDEVERALVAFNESWGEFALDGTERCRTAMRAAIAAMNRAPQPTPLELVRLFRLLAQGIIKRARAIVAKASGKAQC